MTPRGLAVTPNVSSEKHGADDALPSWPPIACVLFRFAFCYFALYILYSLSTVSGVSLAYLFHTTPVFWMEIATRGVVPWIGHHLFFIQRPIEVAYAGDSLFGLVQNLTFVLVAILGAFIWSLLDRGRTDYRRLLEWLMLVMRFTLAIVMFAYGMDKVFPLQFHSITRLDLLQPLGDLSHFDILWRFMAASKPYTILSGCLEVLGGILLLIPSLADAGALLCIIVLSNVVALNVFYKVGVSLFSCNLLLFAIFLASPQFPRLANLLLFNRHVPPRRHVRLTARKPIETWTRIVLTSIAAIAFVESLYLSWTRYAEVQKAAQASVPLQGLWVVDEFSTGEPQRSLFTKKLATNLHLAPGEDRWQAFIIDAPGQALIQLRNGKMDYVNFDLDKTTTTAALSDSGDDQWKGHLNFDHPQQNLLNFTGDVNGVTIAARMHRMDESRFVLTNDTTNPFAE